MKKKKLAIDIGGSYVSLYLVGSGFVLKEPSLVAVRTDKDGLKTICFGIEAEKMVGRTNSETAILSPIEYGLIKNADLAEKMLRYFLNKIEFFKNNLGMEVVVNVPLAISEGEKIEYLSTLYSIGLKNVLLVPSVISDALGAGKFVHTPLTYFVVDIGGSKTDIATINSNQIVQGTTLGIGGNMMDQIVQQTIKTTYNVEVGILTARKVKEEIGTLLEKDSQNIEIIGIDDESLSPKSIIVVSDVVREAVLPYFEKIAQAIEENIASCSPSVSADISRNGIHLCGGVASIPGIESFMTKRLGINVSVFQENDKCAILGAGKLLSEQGWLNQIIKNF